MFRSFLKEEPVTMKNMEDTTIVRYTPNPKEQSIPEFYQLCIERGIIVIAHGYFAYPDEDDVEEAYKSAKQSLSKLGMSGIAGITIIETFRGLKVNDFVIMALDDEYCRVGRIVDDEWSLYEGYDANNERYKGFQRNVEWFMNNVTFDSLHPRMYYAYFKIRGSRAVSRIAEGENTKDMKKQIYEGIKRMQDSNDHDV